MPASMGRTARRQQGNRLQQVGFAGAIVTGKNHRAGIEIDRQRCIIAEICKRQLTYMSLLVALRLLRNSGHDSKDGLVPAKARRV
jgi:hypothetical protein